MAQSQDGDSALDARRQTRKPTLPFARSTRQKPRRWPLVLRFNKGAIHIAILLPVVLHAIFAALICFIDQELEQNLGLPPTIIPSLSIVVGLMLVFRNQTSYNRFWDGRNLFTTMITSVRNLTRSFLACSSLPRDHTPATPLASPNETDQAVRILIAILYATKNHLRAEWGADTFVSGTIGWEHLTGYEVHNPEYSDLLPTQFKGLQDDSGVGLVLQLTYFIEAYIKKYTDTGAFQPPQASQLQAQVNNLVGAYGNMETIRLTSVPVAILIHQKQVLALFGCVLPFALVDEMGWFAVPIVCLVCFALYGIDAIARQLEDPFGFDRNDIKVDGLVEDVREEIAGLLGEWRRIVGYSADENKDGSKFPGHANGRESSNNTDEADDMVTQTIDVQRRRPHSGTVNGSAATQRREMFIDPIPSPTFQAATTSHALAKRRDTNASQTTRPRARFRDSISGSSVA